MQNTIVEKLPACTECQATDVNPPRDAEFQCVTPMKMRVRLCSIHFMDYVEQRLGPGTVTTLAVVQKAGGSKAR